MKSKSEKRLEENKKIYSTMYFPQKMFKGKAADQKKVNPKIESQTSMKITEFFEKNVKTSRVEKQRLADFVEETKQQYMRFPSQGPI